MKKDGGKVGRLYSVSTNGGAPECVVQNLPGISDVAVDPNTGNVYYGLHGESCISVFGCMRGSLQRRRSGLASVSARALYVIVAYCSILAIRKCTRLQSTGATVVCSLLAKVRLYIHLLELFAVHLAGGERSFKIESVGLDGTDRKDFVVKKLSAPNRLYAHEPSDMLYWSDLDLAAVERANVLTGRRCVLSCCFCVDVCSCSEMVETGSVFSPTALSVFDGNVYWADADNHQLYKAPVQREHFNQPQRVQVRLHCRSCFDIVVSAVICCTAARTSY